MRLPVFLAVLVVGCLSACANTDDAPVQLNHLDAWQVEGEASWGMSGAEIVGAGEGDGFLVSLDRFSDFELSLEFSVDAETNSGIFLRCQDRKRIHPETCYEANIWDQHPQQQARTGAIVFRVMPPLAQVHTLEGWNSYLVLARGDKLRVWVNDTLTAELERAEFSAGFIALQRWGGGEVRFRNIRLRELSL